MNRLSPENTSTPEVLLAPLCESRQGHIVGTDGEGRPVVDFEGSPVGPLVARKAVWLDAEGLRAVLAEASESRTRVIQGQDGLALHCGAASVTLLRNGKVSLRGTSVETSAEGTVRIKGMSVQVHTPGARGARTGTGEAQPQLAPGPRWGDDAADIQVIHVEESLVLRCGRARLTLLRSGRILIQGTYVETCAEGINRLEGGAVKIN